MYSCPFWLCQEKGRAVSEAPNSWLSTEKSQELLQVVLHLMMPLFLLGSYFDLTSKTDFIKSSLTVSTQNALSNSLVPLTLPNQLARENFGHVSQLETVVLSHCISSVSERAQGGVTVSCH